MRRCPQQIIDVHGSNLTEMRQLSLEFFLLGRREMFLHAGVQVPLTMCMFLCRSHDFFGSKFFFRFDELCTTSELLIRQSGRVSIVVSTLLYNSQCMTLSSRALEQNVSRRKRTFFANSCAIFCTGIADTPCRKSCFALNFSEVTSFLAWVISKVLATATELVRFFGRL